MIQVSYKLDEEGKKRKSIGLMINFFLSEQARLTLAKWEKI